MTKEQPDPEKLREKMEAGLSREQAIEVLARQNEADEKAATKRKGAEKAKAK